ncbi:RimJ/RimL family protein N-acetyltransferase [Kibdelosporangium banguiense]|uniref:RimJ/RimL family protein N-acetyltransferase n=1 Tax=Kibdelosporangium banguiense TaxID=1365924 RepID=A0ABS4U329_9PSEU|nr:GNAT family protein [Kibdelosporangium banguiense]MBP2331069.1 RimJ/RimL family protein N-acetyltransferase [Kibdelosporangium banguiense]
MNVPMPPWPVMAPACGSVFLREFTDQDVHLAFELGEDPYVPLIGSLPAHPDAEQALAWVRRQRGRLAEGTGFSFAVADAGTGKAVGTIGLWLRDLLVGRASVGYSVSPAHRRRGVASDALRALTTFAWGIPVLYRIEMYIEPWNAGSVRVAESAGYQRGRLLPRHREIGGVWRDMLLYSMKRP